MGHQKRMSNNASTSSSIGVTSSLRRPSAANPATSNPRRSNRTSRPQQTLLTNMGAELNRLRNERKRQNATMRSDKTEEEQLARAMHLSMLGNDNDHVDHTLSDF